MNKEKMTLAKLQRKLTTKKSTKSFNYNYSNLNDVLNALANVEDLEYSLRFLGTENIKVEKIDKDWFWNGETFWSMEVKVGDNVVIDEKIKLNACGLQNDPSKAMGTAISYARRYLLLNYFNINDGGESFPDIVAGEVAF